MDLGQNFFSWNWFIWFHEFFFDGRFLIFWPTVRSSRRRRKKKVTFLIFPFIFSTVAPEPVANCTTINPSAEHFRLSCKPGFDGGMEQFFEVVVRENNSGALVFNVTTTDIEKLDIDNLNAGLSYIATGSILFYGQIFTRTGSQKSRQVCNAWAKIQGKMKFTGRLRLLCFFENIFEQPVE